MARQGITVGEGDMYSCLTSDCYQTIMGILNDSSNEWYEYLDDVIGIDEVRMAMSVLVYSSEYDVYYDPDNISSRWDLMGEYEDIAIELEMLGDEMGVDCGLGVITIINSHQGVGGM